MTLWEIDIYPADGQPDRLGKSRSRLTQPIWDWRAILTVRAARGFLVQGDLDEAQANQLAANCLPTESSSERSSRRSAIAL